MFQTLFFTQIEKHKLLDQNAGTYHVGTNYFLLPTINPFDSRAYIHI